MSDLTIEIAHTAGHWVLCYLVGHVLGRVHGKWKRYRCHLHKEEP